MNNKRKRNETEEKQELNEIKLMSEKEKTKKTEIVG